MRDRIGMLLVGHGTREARGGAEFLQTADLVAGLLPEVAVEPCFLELANPTVAEGLTRLVEQGVGEVVVTPLLLFAAGHAKQDIPRAVATAAKRLPRLSLTQAQPLGSHGKIVGASAARYLASIGDEISSLQTLLIIVGRGSSDTEAIESVFEFTELRRRQTPAGHVLTGFMAVAKPSIDEVLATAALSTFRQIAVQPHLLFYGQLADRLTRMVDQAQERTPGKRWLTVPHLGPDPLVAEAVVDRFWEARL